MVRAGVVDHPSEWEFGGYNEIQTPRRKCVLIAYEKLAELAGCDTYGSFQALHKQGVNDSLGSLNNVRNSRWTQSIATGGEAFVNRVKGELGSKASGRATHGTLDDYELREYVSSYIACSEPEKPEIGPLNTYEWQVFVLYQAFSMARPCFLRPCFFITGTMGGWKSFPSNFKGIAQQ